MIYGKLIADLPVAHGQFLVATVTNNWGRIGGAGRTGVEWRPAVILTVSHRFADGDLKPQATAAPTGFVSQGQDHDE